MKGLLFAAIWNEFVRIWPKEPFLPRRAFYVKCNTVRKGRKAFARLFIGAE